MNLQALIAQQQASVKSLQKLVRAKRASQADLDKAKARLADLEAQKGFTGVQERAPQAYPPRVDQPQAQTWDRDALHPDAGPPAAIVGDEYARLQAEMSAQADQLNRKMADLSNQLHQVPEGVACPELTGPILDLKAQIEAVWDRKRYLERNKRLPPEPTPAQSSLPQLPGNDAGRYEMAYQKRRLVDQKSKLKKKLADPRAKPSKRAEWERELAECELKIQELEFKLS